VANLVVTFGVEKEHRRVLNELLTGMVRLVYLSDLSQADRLKELEMADVLLSLDPARELQPNEFKAIANARLMQLVSAGTDHVPFAKLPSNLIVAGNVGAYAEPMAEHILGMILALSKHLLPRHNELKLGQFNQSNQNRMLRGAKCGIVGFGGIGKATARLLRCFGVKIYAINTTGTTDESVDFIGTLNDLEHVLRNVDVVVISIPLNDATRGLIGEKELKWMKNDAILVNVARGGIIDQAALYEKLRAHPSFMAAIDTWWAEPHRDGTFHVDHQFFELPNFLGSPHNSAIVAGIMEQGARHAVDNVKRFLNGEPLVGVVKTAA
jgi:phosphoglycerate dehydrogenase-like enzyme